MVDKDDWRLQGQEEYLKGATMQFKKYEQFSEEWDHDHCEFCWAKFSDTIQDALKEGYVTVDNSRWVCKDCFNDLKDGFKWTLV